MPDHTYEGSCDTCGFTYELTIDQPLVFPPVSCAFCSSPVAYTILDTPPIPEPQAMNPDNGDLPPLGPKQDPSPRCFLYPLPPMPTASMALEEQRIEAITFFHCLHRFIATEFPPEALDDASVRRIASSISSMTNPKRPTK